MAWTEKGRQHEERMQAAEFEHKEKEAAANRAAQAEADRLHYQNEEKKRQAEERREDKNRASQERIARANADAEKAKAEALEHLEQALAIADKFPKSDFTDDLVAMFSSMSERGN